MTERQILTKPNKLKLHNINLKEIKPINVDIISNKKNVKENYGFNAIT